MAGLTVDRAKEIISSNRQVLYHYPKEYKNTIYYLEMYGNTLKKTLLSVYKFVMNNEIIMANNQYVMIMDNMNLQKKVRKTMWSAGTTSRHMNLLCALGLLNKVNQNERNMLEINKTFLENSNKTIPINVFAYREYTEQEMERIEERATRLREAGVTSGNMSADMLRLHNLNDICSSVYPYNKYASTEKKMEQGEQLANVIDTLIEVNGYTTKQDIKANMPYVSDSKIDKLFRMFKKDIALLYYYKKPTKEQKELYDLKNYTYIYTRKEDA